MLQCRGHGAQSWTKANGGAWACLHAYTSVVIPVAVSHPSCSEGQLLHTARRQIPTRSGFRSTQPVRRDRTAAAGTGGTGAAGHGPWRRQSVTAVQTSVRAHAANVGGLPGSQPLGWVDGRCRPPFHRAVLWQRIAHRPRGTAGRPLPPQCWQPRRAPCHPAAQGVTPGLSSYPAALTARPP